MMLLALISVFLATTPPLVQAPEDAPPPFPTNNTYRRPLAPASVYRPKPPPEPLGPAALGLFFSPSGIFSLSLWVEADVALTGGLDVFANVGGGPLGQFGFDVGLRYYVLGTSLDGFYVDVRGSAFSLPAFGLWMAGPGLQIGYGWRIKRFTLSIAVGVTTWYGLRRADPGAVFAGTVPTDADVIIFPGLMQPPEGGAGVQPTVRVSLGPWF